MREPRFRWGSRLSVLGLLAGSVVVGLAQPANAACHAFTVEVEPATVAEGAAVKVTVSRDAGVGPSQIDVETVDGSARGGSDYQAVPRRTLSFSSETSQSFDVATMDDAEAESNETFKLHLSNPGGCAVNPRFVVGPDAIVTVTDNDTANTTRAPATTATTASATSRSTATTSKSTTSTAMAESTTSTSSEASISQTSTTSDIDDLAAADVDEGDDDSGIPAAVALLALVVAAAGAGVWAWRRRSSPG